MDRIVILNTLKKLLNLFFNNELDAYNTLLTIRTINESNDEVTSVPYKETSIIYYIFSKIPYYAISDKLEEFAMILNVFGQKYDSIKPVITLITAYLEDFDFTIKSRINTELCIHIYEMAVNYNLRLELNPKVYTKIISQSLSDLEDVIGMTIANSINYTQISIPGLQDEPEDLRENISKHNYNTKSNIEKQLHKAIRYNYTKESFNDFSNEVIKTISQTDLDKKQKLLLTEQFTTALTELKNKIFTEKKNKTSNQLELCL